MRLWIFSEDDLTHRRCREVLRQQSSVEWELGISRYNPEDLPQADVYLWDLPSHLEFTGIEPVFQHGDHIFIIDRDSSIELRQKLPIKPAGVLLRPLNQVLLGTFLSELADRWLYANSIDEPNDEETMRRQRDDLLECLLEATVRLQEYDQDRNRFLAYGLHDFRAPLMALDGYCGLLLDRKLGPLTDGQVKAIQRMQRSVKRLSRLSASMLQVSGGDQLQVVHKVNVDDIEDCIAQAVYEVKPVADARNLEIVVQTLPSNEPFWFDRSQMEQLLVNLLDNACRYSPKGGQVSIQGYPVFWDRRVPNLTEIRDLSERREASLQHPNAYHVEVRDSGPGIPKESLETIFQEFQKLQSGDGGKNTGSAGLGLAICRQIVGWHGGRIFAESALGGSRFVFVLPFVHPLIKRSSTQVDDAESLKQRLVS